MANPKLVHFTPLRYPGGKGKLAPFLKALIEENGILDGEYAEPYAGGAAIALELVMQDYVSRVYINDISRPVFAFWHSVLDRTDELLRKVRDTKLTPASWDRQKRILARQDDHGDLELGFATFFLNRTNRSGILNGGMIGGRDQGGAWKLDARYNPVELAARICQIARFRHRIVLSRKDAVVFLEERAPTFTSRTLVYLDPPYYAKGKALYYDYYRHEDHVKVASAVKKFLRGKKWVVSYDNVKEIRDMYRAAPGVAYDLDYTARDRRTGTEVMYFAKSMVVPSFTRVMRPLRGGARPVIAARRV